MTSIGATAEMFFDDNNTYTGVCSSTDVLRIRDAVKKVAKTAGSENCNDNDSEWAACAELNILPVDEKPYWCVDSRGTARTSAFCDVTITVCP